MIPDKDEGCLIPGQTAPTLGLLGTTWSQEWSRYFPKEPLVMPVLKEEESVQSEDLYKLLQGSFHLQK